MFSNLKKVLKKFWEKHICAEFPKNYPPECFDCKRTGVDTELCPFKKKD